MPYPVCQDALDEDRLPSLHDHKSANQLRKILASQMLVAGLFSLQRWVSDRFPDGAWQRHQAARHELELNNTDTGGLQCSLPLILRYLHQIRL